VRVGVMCVSARACVVVEDHHHACILHLYLCI